MTQKKWNSMKLKPVSWVVDEIEYTIPTDIWWSEDDIAKIITQDRQHTKEVLVGRLQEKHTREMQTGESLGKYKAFQRGEEHMRQKALQIIDETFKSESV